MSSCPPCVTVGTGRRPSRAISVSGDGGGVPCARTRRTGARRRIAMENATARRTQNYVRTGLCRNIARSPADAAVVDEFGSVGMTKKVPRRSPLASAPRPRTPGGPPRRGRVPSSLPIVPAGKAPPSHPTRAPRQRPVAKVPRPRRPTLSRARHGGLCDLFEFFPDLPRPVRPASRAPTRRLLRR